MAKLTYIFAIILATALVLATAEQDANPVGADDAVVTPIEIHERQDVFKGLRDRLQNGATNLVKGVEHFVVGVLGAIDNVNLGNQIEEAFKATPTSEDDTTTPDYEEETTPRRTTRRRTTARRVVRVTQPPASPTPAAEDDIVKEGDSSSKFPRTTRRRLGYRTRPRPSATTSIPQIGEEAGNNNNNKVEVGTAPQLDAQLIATLLEAAKAPSSNNGQVNPTILLSQLPSLQPGAAPQYQVIVLPVPPQQGVPNSQPIAAAAGLQPLFQPIIPGQAPVPISPQQPAASPLISNSSAPLTPISNGTNNEAFGLKSSEAQQEPLVPIVAPIQPIVIAAPFRPAAVLSQANPVPNSIASVAPSTKPPARAPAKSTKYPNRLEKYSLSRRPLNRTKKPVVLALGYVKNPDANRHPTKTQAGLKPNPDYKPSQGGQPAPPRPGPLPGNVFKGVTEEPVEETPATEPAEEITEDPEETDNVEPENVEGAVAKDK